MLDFLKEPFLAIQEFYILAGAALRNVFRSPHYGDDVVIQMDQIGVGSLPIVILTGFFSGAGKSRPRPGRSTRRISATMVGSEAQ